MSDEPNERILLVDDMPSIHEDFRKILAKPEETLDFSVESELLGLPEPRTCDFDLDSAYQGMEALAMVEGAVREGRPYAMAFVDMRMPPGWDGMETVERLWQADPRLQVVICTAYSDHPWEDLLERLDVQDRLVILKKPFDMIEVSQLARALTAKWSLARRAEAHALEQAQTVERLRRSEQDLQFTTQELRAFAYSVSHDLQSPLAIIGSFAQLLESELGEMSPKAARFLDRIRSNAQGASDLITGLLALTHIARAELHVEPVNLQPLVDEVVAELRDAAPQRQACVRVEPGLVAWADARLLRIAVRNLVENAWKFSSGREVTLIDVGMKEETGDQRVFFLRDNGCGFDMGHADQLFQNFQRLHSQKDYPGTGIGLVTVRRVLLRHGGRVWAESAPGEGSTFYFSLPARQVAAHGAIPE